MATTTNLGLTLPANGSDVDSWDVPVNGNSAILDAAFGNTTTLNVVSQPGVVTLTSSQYQPRILVATGALTANVNYQLPSGVGGTWSFYNNTSGSYTLTFSSAGGGTSVTLAQGYSTLVISDGTNTRLAYTSNINSFPSGGIIMWSGSVVSIPSGWVLCNGSNGTPNLEGQFIIGAGGSYAVGATGGNASITLSTGQLPAHSHGITDPGHTHSISDPTHTHGVSDPTHSHSAPSGQFMTLTGGSYGSNTGGANVGQNPGGTNTAAASTGISIDAAYTGITNNTATTGITTQNTGSGSSINILPPYYALCYIMKT